MIKLENEMIYVANDNRQCSVCGGIIKSGSRYWSEDNYADTSIKICGNCRTISKLAVED